MMLPMLVTCRASDANGPGSDELTIEIAADTTIVLREALRVSTRVLIGGRELPDAIVRLASADPDILDVSDDGTLITGRQLGRATLTARLVGSLVPTPAPSASRVITVVPRAAAIDPDSLAFASIGERISLTLTAVDALGAVIDDAIPEWRSSDTSRVRVDPLGVATARAVTIAPVAITARLGSYTVSIPATVRNVAVSLMLQPTELSLIALGMSQNVTVTAHNARGGVVGAGDLEWRVSDPGVISLTGSAETRGVYALQVGTADVTVTSGGLSAQTRVSVTNDPTTIRFAADTVRLPYLEAVATPDIVLLNALGDTLPRSGAAWSVDDPLVARITTAGVVTARGAGTTWVRATSPHTRDSLVLEVTNEPASVEIDAELDTLPGLGQSLTYSATVRNGVGAVVTTPIEWSSSNEAAVRVSEVEDGVAVIAVGFGNAFVIARAGAAADTLRLVVRNPTRLHVDNGVFVTQRNGTLARPFARIQDAVSVADALDTIMVGRGAFPYAETVTLSRRLTLLGDAPGFDPANPDPGLLPVIAHDTGAAAIIAHTLAPQVIRRIHVHHTIDGPALDARGSDIEIEHFYVNAGELGRIGRGILIDNSETGAGARILRSAIGQVRGYGIRLESVAAGRISNVVVDGVDSIAGAPGHGIHIVGGVGNTVDTVMVRRAAGTHVRIAGGSSATVRGADLAARNRLIVLDSVSGNSVIANGAFDMNRPVDDAVAVGSALDGRAAVEVRASGSVTISDSWFREAGSMLDAVLLEGGALPAVATLDRVTFARGRYHVRTAGARASLAAVRSDSAQAAILSQGADTITVVDSDIRRAPVCVRGASAARIEIRTTVLAKCGTAVIVGGLGSARLESATLTRNAIGLHATAGASLTSWHSGWFDNDTAAVRMEAGVTAALDSNFWGDARGYRRSTDPAAAGDSIIGLMGTPAVDSAPPASGVAAAGLRAVRGQTASATGTALATVRVIDQGGLPVAGVIVTFTCADIACGIGANPRLQPAAGFSSTGTTAERVVTTRAGGLAEVAVELRGLIGTVAVAANVPGLTGVTVVVTGQ